MNNEMNPPLPNRDCACANWTDHQQIGLGYVTADLLEKDFALERKRNEWLRLVRCLGCGRAWYVALDTVDDDYYFLHLSAEQLSCIREQDQWPNDFDDFVNVWPTEAAQAYKARLHWPWKDEGK
jgi:hypothetical protein